MLPRGNSGMLTDFATCVFLRLQIHTFVARSKLLELSHAGNSVMRERGGVSFVVVRHGWPQLRD